MKLNSTVLFLILTCSLYAVGKTTYIPEPLKAWQEWVLHDHKSLNCPFISNGDDPRYTCTWVKASELKANVDKLDFTMELILYAENWLYLPGDDRFWPEEVQVRKLGERAIALPVRRHRGAPNVHLHAGEYRITGTIYWDAVPGHLKLPKNMGILSLWLDGKRVRQPEVDAQGHIWLAKQQLHGETKISNTEKVQVFRLLRDENPAILETRLLIEISGTPRELRTGQFLLDNFVPQSFISSLPARIEENGDLRIQVKPGRWEVSLFARYKGPVDHVVYGRHSELWPEHEVWSFQADRTLRSVRIEGPEAIDPRQTMLPPAWRNFPAYRLAPGEVMNLRELHRGEIKPEADELTLQRQFYLDFNGEGYTVRDTLRGTLKNSWRLDSHPRFELGSAQLNGVPQLITESLDGTTQGVELREPEIELAAVSRIKNKAEIPLAGWENGFDKVSANLFLPPGWSLLASAGIDRVRHSWLSQWNLWDIFLVLIVVVSVFRLCGAFSGFLAAVTLVLLYHRTGAPVFIWLNLVAVLALLQVTKGRLQHWLQLYQIVSFVLLLLIILPFSISEIRQSVYPQLAKQYRHAQHSVVEYEDDVLPMPTAEPLLESSADLMTSKLKETRGMADDKRSRYFESKSKPAKPRKKHSLKQEYDPDAVIQTGPGLPNWSWHTVYLSWSGPVTQSESMRLYLVPPWANRIGHVLAVLLSVFFAYTLFVRSKLLPVNGVFGRLSSATPVLLAFLFFAGSSSHLEASTLVNPDILKELEGRLIEPDKCLPECASIESVRLTATSEDLLEIDMTVNALAHIGMALPAAHNKWLPQSVDVASKPAVVKFGQQGQLFIRLTSGRHRITLRGQLYGDRIELPFGLPVHNFDAITKGWSIGGIQNGFAKTGTIQLERLQRSVSKEDALLPDPMPPYVIVSRTVRLGLEWNMHTVVHRVAPERGVLSLSIPLIAGESPISEHEQNGKHINVTFVANQNRLEWESILPKQDTLELLASEQFSWTETWRLEVAPTWHVEYSGIAPIKARANAVHSPMWRPWPGESVKISVSRPKAEEGKSLTIDSVNLDYGLGLRANNLTLSFQVRTSQGQDFPLRLPKNTILESISIDGISQPIGFADQKVDIPLHPGKQIVVVKWRSETGIQWLSHLPRLDLGNDLTNIHIKMRLPYDRWPLLVGGPLLGPAVLYWGILFVVGLMAFVLGKYSLTPLRFHHWFLLGIGVSSANVYGLLVIVAWLFALGWRGTMSKKLRSVHFKWLQLILIGGSVVAVSLLVATIPMGLLANPEMHIVGNGSSAFDLRWYQDRTTGLVPDAWVLSLPILAYRIAMLIWSLWLAFALLRWLKWAWLQLNTNGFWNDYAFVTSDENSERYTQRKTDQAHSEEPKQEVLHDEDKGGKKV